MKQIRFLIIATIFFNTTLVPERSFFRDLRWFLGIHTWQSDMEERIVELTAKLLPNIAEGEKKQIETEIEYLKNMLSKGHGKDSYHIIKDGSSYALQGVQLYFDYQLKKKQSQSQDLATQKTNLDASRAKLLEQSGLDPEMRQEIINNWHNDIGRDQRAINVDQYLVNTDKKFHNPKLSAYHTFCIKHASKKPLEYFLAKYKNDHQRAYQEYEDHIVAYIAEHNNYMKDIRDDVALKLDTLKSIKGEEIPAYTYFLEETAKEVRETIELSKRKLPAVSHGRLEQELQKYQYYSNLTYQQLERQEAQYLEEQRFKAPAQGGLVHSIKHTLFDGPNAEKTQKNISWLVTTGKGVVVLTTVTVGSLLAVWKWANAAKGGV